MKRPLLVIGLLLMAVGVTWAQDGGSALTGIPIPPGAKVNTEMNVDRDQLITQLSSFLMMQGDAKGPKISDSDLRTALGSLQRVEFAKMDVKGRYSAVDMMAMFEKKVEGRRVIWNTDGKPGSGMLLIATPDGGYFGAQLSPQISKQGKLVAGSITAVRMIGFVDVANTIKVAWPILTSMGIVSPVIRISK